MANPISVTYTTTGLTVPKALDWRIAPQNVTYAIILSAGTCSFTVDRTYDDINDPAVTPVWISSPALTATTEGTLTGPFQFMRLNITALSGGTLTLKILQGDRIQ